MKKYAEKSHTDEQKKEEDKQSRERFKNRKTVRMRIKVQDEEVIILANVLPSKKPAFIIGEDTFQQITAIQLKKVNENHEIEEITRCSGNLGIKDNSGDTRKYRDTGFNKRISRNNC